LLSDKFLISTSILRAGIKSLKKICLYTLLVAVASFSFVSSAFAEIAPPTINGKAYYLVDYASGAVLAGNNANTRLPLASMSKLMTAYLVLDQIKLGKLLWTDIVTVSTKAAAINESEMKLVAGERISVKELFIGMMVESANDAAYALAEKVGGTEPNFVTSMNQKAKTLGLTKTHYYTCNGLAYKSSTGATYNNYMSAYDISRLARLLVANHSEIYQFTKIIDYTFHSGTSREQKVVNTNWMLPTLYHAYAGVDGLKTGYTSVAGYCFTGTVKRDGFRLMSVMMGTSTKSSRFNETKKLYDYAYTEYTPKTFLRAGESVPGHSTITVQDHSGPVSVVSLRNLNIPIHKGQDSDYTYHVVLYPNVRAPLAKGKAVGNIEIYYKGAPIPGTPPISLVTATAVAKSFFANIF
jgi:serine-type D-Ala-D-Ala carboxypeptidase (penicillin-binding protein 5/6)